MDIVSDAVLLAGHSDRKPELEGREFLELLHERLMSDVPCKGARWEESPSVRLCKLAGAVATGGECENITGINRVVHSSVERHEVILITIPQITGICRFARLQLYLVCNIVVCDVSVCPVVVLP